MPDQHIIKNADSIFLGEIGQVNFFDRFIFPQHVGTQGQYLRYNASTGELYFDSQIGPQGAQGSLGYQGALGYQGTQGTKGAQGSFGAQGLIGLKVNAQSLVIGERNRLIPHIQNCDTLTAARKRRSERRRGSFVGHNFNCNGPCIASEGDQYRPFIVFLSF